MNRACLVTLLVLFGAVDRVSAGVFSYECDSLPVNGGWTLLQNYCDPEEWLDDGKLHYHTQMCESLPDGQQIDYGRALAEFDGHATFFVEFRVFGDGDRSEVPFTSPALLSAWGHGPVLYHFVIARDQVRLARDNPGPTTYYDLDPQSAHTFRVEQYGEESYAFFIDGVLMESGVPGGPYPAFDPAIGMRAKSHALENWVWWEYIRWGDIPADGSGDFDSDGEVDDSDRYFFDECLDNSGENVDAGPGCRWADFDGDTDVDCTDWDAFAAAWTGAGNPSVPAACREPVPATSTWGVLVMTLLIVTTGTVFIRRGPCAPIQTI